MSQQPPIALELGSARTIRRGPKPFEPLPFASRSNTSPTFLDNSASAGIKPRAFVIANVCDGLTQVENTSLVKCQFRGPSARTPFIWTTWLPADGEAPDAKTNAADTHTASASFCTTEIRTRRRMAFRPAYLHMLYACRGLGS